MGSGPGGVNPPPPRALPLRHQGGSRPMPRRSLLILVPVALLAAVLILFAYRGGDLGGMGFGATPPAAVDASSPPEAPEREWTAPPAANAIAPGDLREEAREMNPVPAGTPEPVDRTPDSAWPVAPSGDPALRGEAPDSGPAVPPRR